MLDNRNTTLKTQVSCLCTLAEITDALICRCALFRLAFDSPPGLEVAKLSLCYHPGFYPTHFAYTLFIAEPF